MKIFQEREIKAAYEHAAQGGQALHIMGGRYAYLRDDTPSCFKNRTMIAHLFDQDHERLIRTARSFGVRVIRVEHPATHRQHIDLCGKPLERAIKQANDQADAERRRASLQEQESAEVLLPLDLNSKL